MERAAFVGFALALSGCRGPTELTLHVTTDVPCDRLAGTAVVVGKLDDLEGTQRWTGTSARCEPNGELGALVVVPSGAKNAEVAVKIVGAIGRDPTTCSANAASGCIVARRAIRFLGHENLVLQVPLREICAGIVCDPHSTCVLGRCTPATIADPARCAGGNGCDESVFAAGVAPVGDGGATPDLDAGPGPDVDSGGGGGDAGLSDSGTTGLTTRVVLFGGHSSAGTDLSDTWEWDGVTWALRNGPGPSLRESGGMAPLNGKAVLFGGIVSGGASANAETWEWDGTRWTQRVVAAPPARFGFAMASYGPKIVVFGGSDGLGGTLADTWEWDGTSWAQRAIAGSSPSARSGAAMAGLNGTAVLFGGFGAGVLNDTWEWNGAKWTQRVVAGPPPARQFAAMASLPGKTVMFGGNDNAGTNFGDTWEWNGTAWTQRAGAPPGSARSGHGMAAFGSKAVLFGGNGVPTFLGDTWDYDGVAWTSRAASGPSARDSMMMSGR